MDQIQTFFEFENIFTAEDPLGLTSEKGFLGMYTFKISSSKNSYASPYIYEFTNDPIFNQGGLSMTQLNHYYTFITLPLSLSFVHLGLGQSLKLKSLLTTTHHQKLFEGFIGG